jgi:hypothetical protein
MGKAALILVTAVTFAGGLGYMNQNRSKADSAMQEALYEHGVLAREIAKSGFNVLKSRVAGDFDDYRLSAADRNHKMGKMDQVASGVSGGPVTLSVTGYYNDAEFTISGTMQKGGTSILDALTIDGPVKSLSVKKDSDVSGLDTNPDGTDGSGLDVHAVRTILASAHQEVLDEMPAGLFAGGTGLNDVVTGTETDIWALMSAVQDYEGANLIEYGSKQKFDDETFGSPTNPVVVRVTGKTELKGTTTGYGILYADGGLKMKDDARWEGLVIATGDKPKFEFKDDARVYGAVVLSTASEDGSGKDPGGASAGLPGGHFDVDVFDADVSTTSEVYHEHQYDDDFDRTDVNLLTYTGCKTNGGLCWDDLMAGETDVYVSFINAAYSSGTYRIKSSFGDLTGNPADGLAPTLVDATTLDEFWVDFNALCALQESSPGTVQKDASDRNGSFSIQVHDSVGSAPGDLLYELSVYHHTGTELLCTGPPEVDPDLDGDEMTYGREMKVKMDKNALLQYSSSALENAFSLLTGYSMGSGDVKLVNVSESGVRPNRKKHAIMGQ